RSNPEDDLGFDPRLHEPGRCNSADAERFAINTRAEGTVQAKTAPKRLIGKTKLPSRRSPPRSHVHAFQIAAQLVGGVEAQRLSGSPPAWNRHSVAARGGQVGPEARRAIHQSPTTEATSPHRISRPPSRIVPAGRPRSPRRQQPRI